MELSKRSYKKAEVEELINNLNKKKNGEIFALKGDIDRLNAENKKLLAEVLEYRDKNFLISKSIKDANKKAKEITDQANVKYGLAVKRTEKLNILIDAVIERLKSNDPDKLIYANAVRSNISKILKIGTSNSEKVESLSETIEKSNGGVFNPKSKIKSYIESTEKTNGFNMDEVLNPGKLELEDLCRELGLMGK